MREGAASAIFIKLEIKANQMMILKRTGRFIYAVSEDASAMLLLMRGFAMGTQHMAVIIVLMKLERNVTAHQRIQLAAKII